MKLQRTTLPQSFNTIYIVVILLVFSICTSSAQGNSRGVRSRAQVNQLLITKPDRLSTLNSLLTNENDSVYILEHVEKVYGSAPVVLYTDLENIIKLSTLEIPFENIQLIQITLSNIKDLKKPISLDVFKRFKSLKYVEFLLENEIQESEAQSLVDFTTAEFIVFYQTIKRS